ALEDAAHDVAEFGISRQQDEDAAEMVAIDPLIARGLRLERRDVDVMARHLQEAAAYQVGMAAQEPAEACHFRVVAQRGAVAAVEIGDLLEREVFERELRTDVERRLVDVG